MFDKFFFNFNKIILRVNGDLCLNDHINYFTVYYH